MKLKTFIVSLVVCTGVLCAVMFLDSCETMPFGGSSYKNVRINTKTKYLETRISYPQFSGLTEINKAISTSVLTSYKTFSLSAQKDWNELNSIRKETGSADDAPAFLYNVQCKPIISNEKYASVLIQTYVYDGGAHGNYALDSFTYDISKQKIVSVYEASGYSKSKLAELCRASLRKTISDKDSTDSQSIQSTNEWIDSGTDPANNSFDTFTCDGKKITIYFEPYIVAPYSSGTQTVIFEMKK